jgi:uncharacterized membrane protein YjgN (DUF898 family)
MDEEKRGLNSDFSTYTMDELLHAYDYMDRERHPERFKFIADEIKKRNIKQAEENANRQKAELKLEFRGSAREYFRIWIVNLCLSIITLGIFSAWAKVRKKRYTYSRTILDGTPFQYLGRPIPILKGRIIAAVGFLFYYSATHFFTSLLPLVLVVGLIAAPWIIVRSQAFNTRYSAYRNMTFHFSGTYLKALEILFAWGIIPILLILIYYIADKKIFAAILGIVFVIFGFAFPWWIRRLKNFLIEQTSYGGINGVFSAKGEQFFKIYFISGLITLAVFIPTVILLGITIRNDSSKLSEPSTYFFMLLMYFGYVVGYTYLKARSGNLVWNSTQLGPMRFQSTLHTIDLLELYITNAFGIVISFGLLIPWAVMRTMKYRTDNMHVFLAGDLNEFKGSDMTTVTAVGSETMDIFDMDLSL